MPAAIPVAAKLGAGLLLPFLMKSIGKKALPVVAKKAMLKVPVGHVVARLGAQGAAQLIPRAALTPSHTVLAVAGSPLKHTLLSKGISATGNALGTLGQAGQMILPWGLMLGGKAVETGAQAGGAALQAAGQIPAAFNLGTTQAQKDFYGGTPLDTISNLSSTLGQGGGQVLATVGSGIGSGVGELGKMMNLMNMSDMLSERLISQAEMFKKLKLDPSTARAFSAAQAARQVGPH